MATTLELPLKGRKGEPVDLVRTIMSHGVNLERDLSEFYALVANDPDLSWVSRGAGRMLRAPTVFEDVVKTICTLVRTAIRCSALAGRAPSLA